MAKPSDPRTTWDEGIRGKWHNGWPPEEKDSDAKTVKGSNSVSSNTVKPN